MIRFVTLLALLMVGCFDALPSQTNQQGASLSDPKQQPPADVTASAQQSTPTVTPSATPTATPADDGSPAPDSGPKEVDTWENPTGETVTCPVGGGHEVKEQVIKYDDGSERTAFDGYWINRDDGTRVFICTSDFNVAFGIR